MFSELAARIEFGVARDVLVWRPKETILAASTAVVGGGIGPRHWVLNVEVPDNYCRRDLREHIGELQAALGLEGEGVGMLTAAKVRRRQCSSDQGVDVEVTVGLSHPTWAASDEVVNDIDVVPGTINVVAFLPVRLEDGALLNAIATATEAKSQALWEASIVATGTASDAITILCPLEGEAQRFAGPRSPWGARLARAVRQAVFVGAKEWAS